MKTKFTLIVSITVLVFGLIIGFVLEDPFGSRTPATNQTQTVQQNSNILYTDGTPVYTDNFDGANDTTALKSRGYKPYYRGTGPQGLTATWFQPSAAPPFPAFNGPTTGYVAANYNAVTGANNIDSWLVLPRLSSGGIQLGDSLYFYSRSATGSTYPDSIRVMFSVNDSTPEGTWTELGRFKTNTTTGWELRGFRAPSTASMGRFAIRYCVANGGPSGLNSDYIGIDALSIVRTTVASGPQYYNYNTGGSSNSFPFNMAAGKATNYLFLPGSINQPSPVPSGNQITKVYFRNSTTGSRTYTNLHIMLAQSTITDLTSGAFYAGPWDTVYSAASVTISTTTGEFMGIQLDHPFAYDPTKSLIIFMGQCGATGSGGSVYNTSVSGFKRVWSVGGCPFVPYAGGDASNVHFGIDVEPALTLTVPDLIYYRFENNPTPTTTPNFAVPGAGNPLGSLDILTLTSGGQFDSCVAGTATATAKITTGYNLTTGGSSLTISMYLNNLITPASTRYLFGDAGHSFRCFVGGIAPTNGAVLRGTGVTDVPINNIFAGPTVVHIVYDSATHSVTVYKNGVVDNTVVQATPWNFTAGTGFSVGGYSNSAGLEGKMDEFRLYKRALSSAEIAASWNVELGGTPTGITPITGTVPNNYTLSQNYPNPFNPVTKISFAIPKSGLVTLKVYDVIGREVASLVNTHKNAGSYIVDFDASKLSSGIYFYKLEVNGFVDTKKMMILK